MDTKKASVKIIYQGKNISRDLEPLLLDFTYTDKTEGEADEVELLLRNDDLRWLDSWKPEKGDTVKASIIDENNTELECGVFTVDEGVANGGTSAGDTYSLKGIATGIKEPVRTRHTSAHENKTLREIANKIASKHGFTVQGEIADFKIKYVAQVRETDIAFLHRLSMKYGYVFSVREKKMIFTKQKDLHQRTEAFTIERKKDTSYTITDKITRIYSKAKVKHRNSKTKQLVSKEVSSDTASKDTLVIHTHADNEQQAEQIADSKLYRNNLQQVEMDISGLPGSIYLVSGNNIMHSGWGAYDGKYCINESVHHIDRNGGYSTDYKANKL